MKKNERVRQNSQRDVSPLGLCWFIFAPICAGKRKKLIYSLALSTNFISLMKSFDDCDIVNTKNSLFTWPWVENNTKTPVKR